MKKKISAVLLLSFMASNFAQAQAHHSVDDLKIGILYVVVYAALGMSMVLVAFKLIDWLTPGRLSKQIAEEKNLPLAILAGAMIIGISMIIAASISG